MKVIASSVIRSAVRGESHGGLYVIDFDKETIEQKLDWDYPNIRWDSGGGDRGIRGMVFYGEYLYAAGATYIYKFNKSFELVDKFNHPCFDGTHEMFRYGSNMLCISNQFDAIFDFDLERDEFFGGFQHILGKTPRPFSKDEIIEHSDTLHLDSVSYHDNIIWYAGSTTEYMYGFNPYTWNSGSIKLVERNTHNAQHWKKGVIFNRSIESDTIYQVDDKMVMRWPTPITKRETITNVIRGDHARPEYTRGMAIERDLVAVGTSPATVHLFSLDSEQPVKTAQITTDIRNSVCGLSIYPW